MIGEIKITQHKKDLMGNETKTHLGDLNLVNVQEGSMNIYIGYQVKKDMVLHIIITSEAIYVNMVTHLPITTKKINKLSYVYGKNETSTSRMIIGSQIGVNNYNEESLKQILYNVKCSSSEKYVLKIQNSNNIVIMTCSHIGIEFSFAKEPEISSEEVLGIFKEKIYKFNLIRNIQAIKVNSSSAKEIKKDNNINYSLEKNNKKYKKGEYSPIESFALIILLLFIPITIIVLFISLNKNSNSNIEQTSVQPNNVAEIRPSSINNQSLDEISKTQMEEFERKNSIEKQVSIKNFNYPKILINGLTYNVLSTDNSNVYATIPYLDVSGYIVKVIYKNTNNIRIFAMSPINCSIFNKRINNLSTLEPQMYVDGELIQIFKHINEGVPAIANYICNYQS